MTLPEIKNSPKSASLVFIIALVLLVAVVYSSVQYGQVYVTTSSRSGTYPFVMLASNPLENSMFNTSVGGYLVFNLTIRNIGDVPVRVEGGCSTPLALSVVPPSAVTNVTNPYVNFACDISTSVEIAPGTSQTVWTSSIDQSILQVKQQGNLDAQLSLLWYSEPGPSQVTKFLVPFNAGP